MGSRRRCTDLKPVPELLLVADDINRLLTLLVDFLQTEPDTLILCLFMLQTNEFNTVQGVACLQLHTSAAVAKQIMHEVGKQIKRW